MRKRRLKAGHARQRQSTAGQYNNFLYLERVPRASEVGAVVHKSEAINKRIKAAQSHMVGRAAIRLKSRILRLISQKTNPAMQPILSKALENGAASAARANPAVATTDSVSFLIGIGLMTLSCNPLKFSAKTFINKMFSF